MIQLQVINKILSHKNIGVLTNNSIDREYFSNYADEFDFIYNHYKKYGNTPDIVTVLDKFETLEVLDVTESDEYLVDKLREEYVYNQFVPILTQAAEDIQVDSHIAVTNILPKIEKLMKQTSFVAGVDISKNTNDRLDKVEEIANQRDSERGVGIPTGFDLLDEVTGGLLRGEELFVVAGRPGAGKSWTMLKMLSEAFKSGENVLMYSGEMSEFQVGARLDTLMSNISINSITHGIWNDEQFDAYQDHLDGLMKSENKFVVATPQMLGGRNLTTAMLEGLIQRYNPSVVGIDQLSLMSETIPSREQLRIKYAAITAELYILSSKYGIPIVLNVQASRAARNDGDQSIQLEHLAESDGIGQNASRVVTMQKGSDDTLELTVVKNRYGEDGKTLKYIWDIETGSYTLIGYKGEDDDSDRISAEAKNKILGLKHKVFREGIEAF